MPAGRKYKTDAERRQARLESRRRYNRSKKGKAAYARYEDSIARAKTDTTPNSDPLAELAESL